MFQSASEIGMQQPLLETAYLTGRSTYILPLELHRYNILRKYSGEGRDPEEFRYKKKKKKTCFVGKR
jgi:hypothetical protein